MKFGKWDDAEDGNSEEDVDIDENSGEGNDNDGENTGFQDHSGGAHSNKDSLPILSVNVCVLGDECGHPLDAVSAPVVTWTITARSAVPVQ